MSGRWGIFPQAGAPEPTATTRLRFEGHGLLSHVSAMTVQFGGTELFESFRSKLGEDPLREDADPEALWARVKKSRKDIGKLLMDQGFFPGVGNIYRAEILFAARLHPTVLGRELTRAEFDRVWFQSVRLLRMGFQSGRIITVEKAEATALGVPHLRRFVYNQPRCVRCGGSVASWRVATRTVYACPTCQPKPAAKPETVDVTGGGGGSKKPRAKRKKSGGGGGSSRKSSKRAKHQHSKNEQPDDATVVSSPQSVTRGRKGGDAAAAADELAVASRRQLQAAAKRCSIRANQSSDAIRDALRALGVMSLAALGTAATLGKPRLRRPKAATTTKTKTMTMGRTSFKAKSVGRAARHVKVKEGSGAALFHSHCAPEPFAVRRRFPAKLTVRELRSELTRYGHSTQGLKPALVSRLSTILADKEEHTADLDLSQQAATGTSQLHGYHSRRRFALSCMSRTRRGPRSS